MTYDEMLTKAQALNDQNTATIAELKKYDASIDNIILLSFQVKALLDTIKFLADEEAPKVEMFFNLMCEQEIAGFLKQVNIEQVRQAWLQQRLAAGIGGPNGAQNPNQILKPFPRKG